VARRVVTRGVRASRRLTHWFAAAGAATITVTGSTLLFVIQARHEGETIVRVRGLLSAIMTVGTTGNGFFGAFGMGKVTSAAAAAGVGSIPTPITEESWDGWLLHQYFNVLRGVSDGGNGAGAMNLELDSKAMRKLSEDEAVVGVLEVVENGTATLDVQTRVRTLWMTG